MERLTADDAAFLHLEDQVSAMHNVTVGIFEGPEPSHSDIVSRVAQRVPLVPRLRQRVIDVPLHIERPVWIDDPHFNLDYHIRHTGLPAGGGRASLQNLIGRLLSQRLDRGKPLWELWMVSGLPDGQWAIVSKAHHSMIDGVSGTDPLGLIIDQVRGSRRASERWKPDPLPADSHLLGQAAVDLMFDPVQQMRLVRRFIGKPIRRTIGVLSARRDEPGLVGAAGPHRRWSPATVSFDDVRATRDRLGVATNDVVLGLASAGYRSMLIESKQPVPASLRTLVPLAVATGDSFTNEMSALEAQLPVGEANLDQAILSLSGQTTGLSSNHKAVAGATLSSLKGLASPTLCALGLRTATRAGVSLKNIETVIVNSPGPKNTITLLGKDMVEIFPAIPLVAKVRISVGVMSYCDSFYFGVSGDLDAGLEVEALAAGIERAAELLR